MSPRGAYREDSQLEGEAKLEFEATYEKTVPHGKLVFSLKSGKKKFDFKSVHIDLLVVNREGLVWLDGTGRVKDDGSEYSFWMKAKDDLAKHEKDEPDGFGIEIKRGMEDTVYDMGGMVFDTSIKVKTKI